MLLAAVDAWGNCRARARRWPGTGFALLAVDVDGWTKSAGRARGLQGAYESQSRLEPRGSLRRRARRTAPRGSLAESFSTGPEPTSTGASRGS
jgi:hypothetical protein